MENCENTSRLETVPILHIAMGSGTLGGATRFSLNYYKCMNHSKIKIDFLFCNENSLGLVQNDEVLHGSEIYALHALKSTHNGFTNYIVLEKRLYGFLKKHSYKIVHINTGSLPIQVCCLIAAYCAGVKIRIAHSHSAGEKEQRDSIRSRIKSMTKPLNQMLVRSFATEYFACSIAAGENLFGLKALTLPRFRLIRNAIDTTKYLYNTDVRAKVRTAEGIQSDKLVFAHVGRMEKVKNHGFLIDVFIQIHKKNPNTVLWIVGDGPLRQEIENKITAEGMQECIRVFGERNDIEDLMQAMDAMLLPSQYEGLSIVSIEAQTAGLPVYASTSISPEHNIAGTVRFLSLEESPMLWADGILKDLAVFERKDRVDKMVEAGYDIHQAARELEKFYLAVGGD